VTELLGYVILYPYNWQPEQSEDPAPKERTACATLEYGGQGNRMIVLVAISDLKSEGAIQLTAEEIFQAGLLGFRKAFVHLGHYNVDRKVNSFTYNPRQKPKGRLSKALTQKMALSLLANIRSGRTIKIARD
jgi:hypothetical protein